MRKSVKRFITMVMIAALGILLLTGYEGKVKAAVQILNSAVIGSAPTRTQALAYRGTDYHTCVYTEIDTYNKIITPYVKYGADLTNLPAQFDVVDSTVTIKINGEEFINGDTIDLSENVKVTFIYDEQIEEYTIEEPILSANSVLPGQYADPDIDYFDGKFWIFPTTDGFSGWSGTVFHAWSSKDLINWEDKGIIMELANNNPGDNENGVEIATSGWASRGSAWAPTIEEKDGKYYFYYCGKDSSGTSQIGVAVADDPAGPYTDKGEPLITVAKCRALGINMGQAIDPSIFTDDDGTSYVTFGNGSAAIVTLNDDMMSIDESSMKQINGLTDFRESVVVIKKDDQYHWTWTCDDANSPNYRINYGISDSLYGPITVVHRPMVQKVESLGILGTGHQSILVVPDKEGNDHYLLAYHRFYTPVGIFTSSDGLGVHRETCIDEITFDETTGRMNVLTPTHEGVTLFAEEDTATPEPEATEVPNGAVTTEPVATPVPSQTVAPSAGDGASAVKVTFKGAAKKKVVTVKAKKKIVIKIKVVNKGKNKVKWSLDKKAKKLFKLTKKQQSSVTLVSKGKKGKGKLIITVGKKKIEKTVKVK